MKVMFINTSIYSGSTGKIIEEICKVSSKRFISYSMLYSRGNSKQSLIKSSYRITNTVDLIMEFIGTRVFDAHGLSSFLSTRKAIRLIKSIKPDIIHIHNLHGYYINYKLLFEFLNSTDIKIIWTLHDCWSYTGHCSHYMDSNCNKWKSNCFQCPEKKYYPKSIITDNSKRNYLVKKKLFSHNRNITVVPIAKWMYRDLKFSILNNTSINVPITNGINIELYKPSYKNQSADFSKVISRQYLLGISNKWDNKKGLNDFLALSKLIDYNIILVGALNEDISGYKNIIHIDKTENLQDLCYIYSNAKVLLNLSHQETFPTIILESLACNTPAISYNVGGSKEIIQNGINGYLVSNNINAIITAIERINEIERSNLRKEVLERYNSQKNFIGYHRLYDKLINE